MELAFSVMAGSEAGIIYSAEEIAIDQRKVVAGQTTFAIDSIQAVWVQRYSQLAWLAMTIGVLLLMFGGTMMSCGGLFMAALADQNLESWTTKGWLCIAAGVMLIFSARRVPPFYFVVHATIGGEAAGIYRTNNFTQAQQIQQAISVARELQS